MVAEPEDDTRSTRSPEAMAWVEFEAIAWYEGRKNALGAVQDDDEPKKEVKGRCITNGGKVTP